MSPLPSPLLSYLPASPPSPLPSGDRLAGRGFTLSPLTYLSSYSISPPSPPRPSPLGPLKGGYSPPPWGSGFEPKVRSPLAPVRPRDLEGFEAAARLYGGSGRTAARLCIICTELKRHTHTHRHNAHRRTAVGARLYG
jgi:hypothetical protein